MKNTLLFLFVISLIALSSCKTTESTSKTTSQPSTYRIGFYNVENLFDLKDEKDKWDDEFTPTGKKKWTNDRYQKKLADLSKVVEEMQFPSLLGLCEVENATVLKDFSNTTAMKPNGY